MNFKKTLGISELENKMLNSVFKILDHKNKIKKLQEEIKKEVKLHNKTCAMMKKLQKEVLTQSKQ